MWKPSGGCKFSGSNTGLVGNSALRFCLLVQWHSIPVRHTEPEGEEEKVTKRPRQSPGDNMEETQG